jgi:arsenate reductase (glutaredoxin)
LADPGRLQRLHGSWEPLAVKRPDALPGRVVFQEATARARRRSITQVLAHIWSARPADRNSQASFRLGRIATVPTLTVYEKPTCTTCRKLRELLTERGVDFESIDYHLTGVEETELRELLHKLGTGPREILRMREPLVKGLGLDEPEASDDRLITQMVAHPALIQRPIVVRGDRALLARPIERALELP